MVSRFEEGTLMIAYLTPASDDDCENMFGTAVEQWDEVFEDSCTFENGPASHRGATLVCHKKHGSWSYHPCVHVSIISRMRLHSPSELFANFARCVRLLEEQQAKNCKVCTVETECKRTHCR